MNEGQNTSNISREITKVELAPNSVKITYTCDNPVTDQQSDVTEVFSKAPHPDFVQANDEFAIDVLRVTQGPYSEISLDDLKKDGYAEKELSRIGVKSIQMKTSKMTEGLVISYNQISLDGNTNQGKTGMIRFDDTSSYYDPDGLRDKWDEITREAVEYISGRKYDHASEDVGDKQPNLFE